jgi:hypothetical protein
MDLLDDFDRVRQTFAELSDVGKRLDSTLAEEPPVIQPAVAAYDLPSLSVEVTVRQASRSVPATIPFLLQLLALAPVQHSSSNSAKQHCCQHASAKYLLLSALPISP